MLQNYAMQSQLLCVCNQYMIVKEDNKLDEQRVEACAPKC